MKNIFIAIIKMFSPTANYAVGIGRKEADGLHIDVHSEHQHLGDATAHAGTIAYVRGEKLDTICFNHRKEQIDCADLPISIDDIKEYNRDSDNFNIWQDL